MNAVLFPRPSQAAPPEPYDGMPVSEADYWEHYYLGHDVTYEWNNGVLEEKGVSDHLTFQVFDWFIQLLIEFLRARPIAERVGLEMGFRLRLPDQTVIRRPDYGLVLHDNPVPLQGLDPSYRGIFDLCLEGVSTTSRIMQERDTVVKKAEYAAGGVREYYLLHHTAELRAFYRLTDRGIYEPIPATPEGIVSSAVLPGFRWRLADLDRQPPLDTLIADPVYQDFVLLNVQRERQRADQEAARADQERARAKQAERQANQERAYADQERARADQERARAEQAERQAEQERARAEQELFRAERLAARLRALGLDPDASE